MPKVDKKDPPKQPKKDASYDALTKGQAYILAETADQLGLLVRDVSAKRLREVGLPETLPHHVRLLAHQIHRDMVDSAHFRLRKTVGA